MPASYNEEILDNYPQHIAAAYARFIDQRDPAAQHNLLLALLESTLKYIAAAAAAQYNALGGQDAAVTDALSRMGHPSLGHWTGLLRSVLAWRKSQNLSDADFVFPQVATLYGKPAAELVAGAELVRQLQKSGAAKVSLRQILDALVEYRNSQAHGAGQGGSYFSTIVPVLQAALEEILVLAPAVAKRNLVFVESVSLERGGARTVTLLRLSSDRPRLRPVRETLEPEDKSPEPQQLYLQNSDGSLAKAISLHPLVVFIPACETCGEPQVGILNGLSAKEARYLCYGCGHSTESKELFNDVSAFIPAPPQAAPTPPPAVATTSANAAEEAEPVAPATPNNLPLEQTELVGRERDVAEVLKLRGRPAVRLVTLTGPGGTGKTRLALESAEQLLPTFSDGVWLVDLSTVQDSSLVVGSVAEVLGVGEVAGSPLLDTLKKSIADKQMLFVLDNFEQVTAAADQVSSLLKSASRIQVLVTSRIPLQLYGEKEYAVQPLGLPPRDPLPPLESLAESGAIKLFVERAQAVRSDFQLTEENAAAVAEICARLDGLPLAIELAAARTRMFPAPALLARLDQSLQILTGGARDLPERQQTMRGTIAWSYDLLGEDEKRLFWRLAVFHGGARLEEIEAVLFTDADPALRPLALDSFEGLELLVSKSLVQQRETQGGEPRFHMLETIRAYASEKLGESGETELLARGHSARFLALAQEAASQLTGNDQAKWLARLEEEQANMRAALEFSLGPAGDGATGLRLAVALYRFWGVRGHLTEGRNWLQRTLAASDASSPGQSLRASALNAAGGLARVQSDFAAAADFCNEALLLYREAGDKPGTAASLRLLTAIAVEQNELDEARRYGDEGLAIYRELADTAGMMVLLNDMGLAAHQAGDLDAAMTLYQQALDLRRKQGHKRGIAVSLNNLGLIQLQRGDLDQAETLFDESRDILAAIGDQTGTAVVLTNMANLRQEQGDSAGAATLHRQNLKLFAEQGSMMRVAEALEGLAGPAASIGLPERAARLLAAAAALRQSSEVPLPAWEQRRNERFTAAARQQLDDETWQKAWQEGRNMAVPEIVAYALSQG